jgi:pentatricopeptide repeat protein
VTFTTIICGLLTVARTQEAFDFLHRIMLEQGVRPGVVTYNAVLHGVIDKVESVRIFMPPDFTLPLFKIFESVRILGGVISFSFVKDLCPWNSDHNKFNLIPLAYSFHLFSL